MGATTFYNVVKADDAESAFAQARQQACYDYGHSGYTGTIAEKPGYQVFQLPKGFTPEEWFYKLSDLRDEEGVPREWRDAVDTYNDKWGLAVCVKYGGHFHFGGWASY